MSENEQKLKDRETVQKKTWEAPRILSDEPLEAAAATCDPPSGGFGKSVADNCNPAMLGS